MKTSVCLRRPFPQEFERVRPRSKFCQANRENALPATLSSYDWVVVVWVQVVVVVIGTGKGIGTGKSFLFLILFFFVGITVPPALRLGGQRRCRTCSDLDPSVFPWYVHIS